MTAPLNDNFADATEIVFDGTGHYESAPTDTTDATAEEMESYLPNNGLAVQDSVWWKFTPTEDGMVQAGLSKTAPERYPTMLQMFWGTEIADLVLQAESAVTVPDQPTMPEVQSQAVEAGRTYYFYVTGLSAAPRQTLTFWAQWVATPEADTYVNASGISDLDEALDLDLTGATPDPDVTSPPGLVGTLWATWVAPDEPPSSVVVRLSNPAATLAVWSEYVDPNADPDVSTSPQLGAQVGVADPQVTGVPAEVVLQPEPGMTYYAQVGVRAGDPLTTTLTWSDATPEDYQSPDAAIVMDGIYGETDVDIRNNNAAAAYPMPGTDRIGWLTWVADVTGSLSVTVERTDGPVGMMAAQATDAAYAEVSSASTTDDTLTFTVPVTADQTYFLNVGTAGPTVLRVTWNIDPVIVDPAPPDEYLRVLVYQSDGKTLITEVPRRYGCSCSDPLNAVGAGQISVRLDDPVIAAYPTLFAWRNVVKFWLGTKCIGAFRIRRRRTTYVSNSEWSGYVKVVSGPTLLNLLGDFMVKHYKQRADSVDSRFYGWASPRGEWYSASDWDSPVDSRPLTNPPGDWNKPAKKRAKWKQPEKWPDRGARWIYRAAGVKKGNRRFHRKTFTLKRAAHVRLMVSADERVVVYLDGEPVIESSAVETGYTSFEQFDTVLARGSHTIAVFNRGLYSVGGDANDSVLISLMRVNTRGKPTSVVVHSNESWETRYGSARGWNKAMIMRSIVQEAQARGNTAANLLTIGFTKTTDSRGQRWTDGFNNELAIGTSALDVQGQFSESGTFDMWVEPDTLVLKAAKRRGVNKSSSVTLEPGRNLLNWSVEESDEVENTFLIQYDGGWTSWTDKPSTRTYGRREAYVSLGNSTDDADARSLMSRVAQGVAAAEQRAGTGEMRSKAIGEPDGGMIAVDGARPFLDFTTGDTVKAPNANGVLTPHRVMGLTVTEDQNGYLSYDPDLQEVR